MRDANVHAGSAILTAGLVNGYNQLGGNLLVQLQPIDDKRARAVGDLLTGIVSDSDRTELLSNTVTSSSDSHMIIYCLLTPRPFFAPDPTGHMIVKGTVIAAGRTFRGDGTTAQVTYMACSSAESL